MDILQLIFSFLSKDQSFGKFQKIFDLLKENSFDIPAAIKNADLTTLAPVFMDFLSQNKNSPDIQESYGVKPIENLADQVIVERINNYLSLD